MKNQTISISDDYKYEPPATHVWEGSLVKIKNSNIQGIITRARKGDALYEVQFFDGALREIYPEKLETITAMPIFHFQVGDLVREWYDYEAYAIAPSLGKVVATSIGDDGYPSYDILWSDDLRTTTYNSTSPKYLLPVEKANEEIERIRSTGETHPWSAYDSEYLLETKYGHWWLQVYDGLDTKVNWEEPTNNQATWLN